MSLASIESLFDDIYDKEDERSYSNYILDKAKALPDAWRPREKMYESERQKSIHFKDELGNLKDYCKAYALESIAVKRLDVATVSAKVSTYIGAFVREYAKEDADIKTSLKEPFLGYIGKMKESVRNSITKTDKSLSISTARNGTMEVFNFIVFLSHYSNANIWVATFDPRKDLPSNIAKYFTLGELESYKMEISEAQTNQKTRSMNWTSLHEMIQFLQPLEPSYIKTAIILGVEAGLRISEIRHLKADCLKPIGEAETEATEEHLSRLKHEAPISLDYSESYWLDYHVIKGKSGELIEGAPILVGKSTKKVIDELKEITEEFREESGSDMLFLNKRRNGIISVRSYTALLNDLYALIRMGMPIVRFHELRATFATILHRLDVPIPMIEKYMNHVISDVTVGYIDDQRSESSRMLVKVLDGNVTHTENDEAYGEFKEELLSLVESDEFVGLSHNSRIALFERLMSRHNIKMSLADHGTCILQADENCPSGFDGVLPCHETGCGSFYPDTSKENFFVKLLNNKRDSRKDLEIFAEEHRSVEVDFSILDNSEANLMSIIEMIQKRGGRNG